MKLKVERPSRKVNSTPSLIYTLGDNQKHFAYGGSFASMTPIAPGLGSSGACAFAGEF